MSACEKCWGDAYTRSQMFGGSQVDHYADLIKERTKPRTPCICRVNELCTCRYSLATEDELAECTPQERAGQYWDEHLKVDRRLGT